MTKITSTDTGVEPMEAVPEFDQRAFRTSVGRFATGVVALTFEGEAGPKGITLNSFTSVSLDPPLILVSIAKSSRSHDQLSGRDFAVNILASDQIAIARHFAGSPMASDVVWAPDHSTPSLPGALARLFCTPWATYDGGDHSLVVGRVLELDERRGDALAYHEGRFATVPAPRPWLPHDRLTDEEYTRWL